MKRPDRRQLVTLLGYAGAAAIYITIGVTVTDFLLSFWVGVAYIVVTAWTVPALLRHVRVSR